jgi:hypothetical protein
VSEPASIVYFPVASNAKTMLTGASGEALRRRLKFASVFYDAVLLEAGTIDITAGPHASSRLRFPNGSAETGARWQTPAERGKLQSSPFAIGIGREDTPGVPAKQIDTVHVSDTAISWRASFEPLLHELPTTCDWVSYGNLASADPKSIEDLAQSWADADGSNPALERAVPVDFARKMVIQNANHDLAMVSAAQPRMSASFDSLHTQVVAQRLTPGSGWSVNGFSVPILFPRVGTLTWDEIAELRRDRHITRFRGVLREIEAVGLDEAATGDVEAAAHRAFQRYLAEAASPTDSVMSALGRATVGMIVSAGAGIATLGLSPAVAVPLGVVVGGAPPRQQTSSKYVASVVAADG